MGLLSTRSAVPQPNSLCGPTTPCYHQCHDICVVSEKDSTGCFTFASTPGYLPGRLHTKYLRARLYTQVVKRRKRMTVHFLTKVVTAGSTAILAAMETRTIASQ